MSDFFSRRSAGGSVVLDVVLDLLAERGCEGLTASELQARAAAAGLVLDDSPDLEALVVAALERVRLFPAPDPTGDLQHDLRALLEPWRVAPGRDERVVAALLSPAMWRPRLREAVHDALDRPLMHAIAAVVARSADRGQVPDRAVQTLCWVLRGLMIDRLRSRPRSPVDIDLLVEFLVAGLRSGWAESSGRGPSLPEATSA